MPLTPDQIEKRTFTPAVGGFDPGEVRSFLSDVAAALRLSQHATRAPGAVDPPEPAPTDPILALGAEVEGILRAATEAADSLREKARLEADQLQAEAEERATQAEARARRVLVAAQGTADGIVAEAQAQAKAIVTTAREQAEAHADHVTAAAREQAELLLRHERDTLRRLHDAQSELTSAIGALEHAPEAPVLDITARRPLLRLGDCTIDLSSRQDEDGGDTAETGDRRDPVARLVQAAIQQASTHPVTVAEGGGERVASPEPVS